MTGYLIAGAILVIIEAAAGHNRLTGWSYIIFSYMFAWITVSIIGLIKGWFY